MPSPTIGPDARRQALIIAATEAFARDGFALARIGDIAEAAGIGKGTVYEYYPSKEALLLACTLHRCETDRAAIQAAIQARFPAIAGLIPSSYDGETQTLPPIADPEGALREILITGLTLLLENAPNHCRIFLELFALARANPELGAKVAPAINALLQRWEAMLRFLIEAGIDKGAFRPHPDVPALARMFTATVDGLFLQRTWRHDLSVPEWVRRTVEAFITLLRKDP